MASQALGDSGVRHSRLLAGEISHVRGQQKRGPTAVSTALAPFMQKSTGDVTVCVVTVQTEYTCTNQAHDVTMCH